MSGTCCYWLFLVYLHQVTPAGMGNIGCYSITQVYIIFIKTTHTFFTHPSRCNLVQIDKKQPITAYVPLILENYSNNTIFSPYIVKCMGGALDHQCVMVWRQSHVCESCLP